MDEKSRIKVGFLEESAQVGGAEVNVLNLMERLDTERIEILAICPFEGSFSERVRRIGGSVVLVSRAPLFSTSVVLGGIKLSNPFAMICNLVSFFFSALVLARCLRRERVDILHTLSLLAHFYGGLAARLARVPCLWHVQDIVDDRQFLGIPKRILNLAGGILPQRIVVPSKPVAEMFDSPASSKVRIIYNAVDLARYSRNESGDRIRGELGIGLQDTVVGIIARIVHWKGHQAFLQAAQKVHEQIPQCRFLVVGDASFGSRAYELRIRELASELGLEGVVIFTGFRTDVPDLIAAMDVVVNPSVLPDPLPLAVIEAMAGGKPVVGTNAGGIPEMIVDGVTGTLIPMKDVAALEKAIVDLLQAPKKRQTMGEAGRKRVEELFTIDRIVQKVGQEYLQLTQAHEVNRWG